MLSPYKLYKHDTKHQRVAVTKGPRGKPYKGCSGTHCYNHKTVDWTIHRLTPAVYERGKVGGKRRKMITKTVATYAGDKETTRRPKITLQATSPRWGEGIAPSRRRREYVPLPKKGTAEISGKTKVVAGAVGAAAVSYGGYRAYKHIKEKRRIKPGTHAAVKHTNRVGSRDQFYYRTRNNKRQRVRKGKR